MQEFDLYAQLV